MMGAASAGGDYIDGGSYGQLPEGHDENSDSADSEPEIHVEQAPNLEEEHHHNHHNHHHHHSHGSEVIGVGGFGGHVVGGVDDRYEYVSGVGN